MTDSSPEDVIDLLADEYAREILAKTSVEAMSVKELSDACDASEMTIYRRINQLESEGLLREQLQLDRDGHHYNVYEVTLEKVTVELNDGDYHVTIKLQEDTAERFAQMWKDIRRE